MKAAHAEHPLEEIVEHVQRLAGRLEDVVLYLDQLSGQMNTGMAEVTTDIGDTLGNMQFQDIDRQLLEQINTALGSQSDQCTPIYRLIDGDASPLLLEEVMAGWTDSYVMHTQRVAHAQALGRAVPEARDEPAANDAQANGLTLTTANGPRIELF